MTTTAGDLITEALSLIGSIGGGETPSGQDMETCLYSLNSMLDSWATEKLFAITVAHSVLYGWASRSFTAGPGGDMDIVRPAGVADGCFCRVSGTDSPIYIVSEIEYAEIEQKDETADAPSCIRYSGSVPLAVCYLWPVPTGAGDLHIALHSVISEFATISDVAVLPQGGRRAIAYSLAEEIWPKSTRGASDPSITRKAAQARMVLKRSHYEVPRMKIDPLLESLRDMSGVSIGGGGSEAETWDDGGAWI